MQRDFTVVAYKALLDAFLAGGYTCTTYRQHIEQRVSPAREVILRHDVDRNPERSLTVARAQYERGVTGTYYFRSVPQSFVPSIIEAIAGFGHEIGYHYEDLTIAGGDTARALELFEESLSSLRRYYPVVTACMHGSPATRWDNRDMWTDVDYREFGIIAEPYFDTDFTKICYVTDTGRAWNRTAVSVRDKVRGSVPFAARSTADFINKLEAHEVPRHVMLTVHPQRWNDHVIPWAMELVGQSAKNQAKRILIGVRGPLR